VIRGFDHNSMVLFTNLEVNIHDSGSIYQIVKIDLTQWKRNECYRYIKQSYNLADLRVRRRLFLKKSYPLFL